MSVLKWKQRKRSSDSIYDVLHLVRHHFSFAFFLYLTRSYGYCYAESGRWLRLLFLNIVWQTIKGFCHHSCRVTSSSSSTGRLTFHRFLSFSFIMEEASKNKDNLETRLIKTMPAICCMHQPALCNFTCDLTAIALRFMIMNYFIA